MRISGKLKNGNYKRGNLPFPLASSDFHIARRKMVEEQLIPRGIRNPQLLQIFSSLPRHLFVEEALAPQAYKDSPIAIGFGQTISQPYMVALMVEALKLQEHESVLEIGTGCGYQTAVLARLVRQVFSIERLQPLFFKARKHLRQLSIQNVILRLGDGTHGWPERAPFDAIVAAAVSPQIPPPLLAQLKEGGRLILPIERNGEQFLVRAVKAQGGFTEEILEGCRFVKMVGSWGYREN